MRFQCTREERFCTCARYFLGACSSLGPFVELHDIPLCPILQPVQVPLFAPQPSGIWATPFSFFCKLADHTKDNTMKRINVIGPGIDTWGTWLVTDLLLHSSATDHNHLSAAVHLVFSSPHRPVIQPVQHQISCKDADKDCQMCY